MTTKSYVVTDEADINTLIAGKRRTPGDKLRLTAAEAEWEERRGVIKLDDAVVEETGKKAEGKKD